MARFFVAAILAAWGNAAVLATPASAAPAPEIRKIGEEKAAGVALAGTEAAGHVIHEPGSTYIKVHLRLSPDAHITVSNPDKTEVHTYHGTRHPSDSDYTLHQRAGFAALSIDGDTAVVTRHGKGSVHIDSYWRGYRQDELGIQSVCGTDARRDVVCYQSSHASEYSRSNAVAKLLIGGGGSCTTWRVGNTNRMLTNKHCIDSQSDVQSSEVQFNYQCATCGGNNPGAGTKVSGAQLFKVSAGGSSQLDYTLYSVNNFSAISGFGTLFLETRAPVNGERIYIPGHGDGAPKRLSIYEDSQGGAVCTVRSATYNSYNMSYSCDTSGGNSGSPVLSANHKVLALHHLGGCPNNQGARMHLIYNEIKDLIDNGGGTPPPSGCNSHPNTRTGTLGSGASAYQPDGSYYYSGTSGTHAADLCGPSGTDFDLYLQKWNGRSWVVVAQGITSSNNESISYSGTSGYYRYRVHAYSGSGSYTLGYTRP